MLTPSQYTTLKNHITASSDLNSIPAGSDGDVQIAALMNAQASPAFTVWKTSVPVADVKDTLNYTTFIGRSGAEREAFAFMLSNHVINPSRPNIRQGVADIFSGAGGSDQRDAFLVLFKRLATRAEKLFATGTGSNAVPANLTFEGQLSYTDVGIARES